MTQLIPSEQTDQLTGIDDECRRVARDLALACEGDVRVDRGLAAVASQSHRMTYVPPYFDPQEPVRLRFCLDDLLLCGLRESPRAVLVARLEEMLAAAKGGVTCKS